MKNVKVYAKFDNDNRIVSFQGRANSKAAKDEFEFPFNWQGSIGDHKDDFDKNGIKKE